MKNKEAMSKNTTDSYLTFRLQGELFAVGVTKVLEIIETGEEHSITNLPMAPDATVGVVNFRGNVIPVIDTRQKFDLNSYDEGEKFVIMILTLKLNNRDHFVGAMADKVVDVIEINEDVIQPFPEVVKGYDSKFIRGVVHRKDEFIMLVDLEAAISTSEIENLHSDTVEEVAG